MVPMASTAACFVAHFRGPSPHASFDHLRKDEFLQDESFDQILLLPLQQPWPTFRSPTLRRWEQLFLNTLATNLATQLMHPSGVQFLCLISGHALLISTFELCQIRKLCIEMCRQVWTSTIYNSWVTLTLVSM